MLPKSIRWRIQVWHGSLLVCLVSALLVTFYIYERSERIREIDSRLESLMTPLLPRVTPPPGRDPEDFRGPPPRRNGPPGGNLDVLAMLASGQSYYLAWTPGGEIMSKSSNAPPVVFPGRTKSPGLNITRARDEFREILHYGPNGDCVLIGTSIAPVIQQLHGLAVWLVVIGFAIVAFGLAGGWWVAGHTLEPILQISS